MHIQEHDPATISPARREMDDAMDGLLLELRKKARQGLDAEAFSRWMMIEVYTVRLKAEEAGEQDAFERRFKELFDFAEHAGLAKSH